MKFENISTINWQNAFRGLRNPLESWSKSDSGFTSEKAYLGQKDLDLAVRMVKAGTSDRKFLRQIMVSMDITAPLYWQFSFCQ